MSIVCLVEPPVLCSVLSQPRHRSNHRAGPGSFVVMWEPPVIDKWMAGTNCPLMNTADSLRPALIPAPIIVKERTVAEGSLSMQSWHRKAVWIEVLSVALLDIACTGTMCDGLEMYANRTLAMSCPCYVHDDRESGLCGAFRLKLTFPNGEERVIDNFTSKKFTSLFMRDRVLPRRVTASMFSIDRTMKTQYVTAVRNILDHFNHHGGCRFTGWVRQGEIVDAGVEQPQNPRFDLQSKVAAGKLTYHITSIVPHQPLSEADQLRMSFDHTIRR